MELPEDITRPLRTAEHEKYVMAYAQENYRMGSIIPVGVLWNRALAADQRKP